MGTILADVSMRIYENVLNVMNEILRCDTCLVRICNREKIEDIRIVDFEK